MLSCWEHDEIQVKSQPQPELLIKNNVHAAKKNEYLNTCMDSSVIKSWLYSLVFCDLNPVEVKELIMAILSCFRSLTFFSRRWQNKHSGHRSYQVTYRSIRWSTHKNLSFCVQTPNSTFMSHDCSRKLNPQNIYIELITNIESIINNIKIDIL